MDGHPWRAGVGTPTREACLRTACRNLPVPQLLQYDVACRSTCQALVEVSKYDVLHFLDERGKLVDFSLSGTRLKGGSKRWWGDCGADESLFSRRTFFYFVTSEERVLTCLNARAWGAEPRLACAMAFVTTFLLTQTNTDRTT